MDMDNDCSCSACIQSMAPGVEIPRRFNPFQYVLNFDYLMLLETTNKFIAQLSKNNYYSED